MTNTTNKDIKAIYFDQGGVEGLFDTVILSSEEGIRKPDFIIDSLTRLLDIFPKREKT